MIDYTSKEWWQSVYSLASYYCEVKTCKHCGAAMASTYPCLRCGKKLTDEKEEEQ